MRARRAALYRVAMLAAAALVGQTGCSLPSSADAAATGNQPSDALPDNSDLLADFARSPTGADVDFADLTVGDLVVFTLPATASVDPRTGLPTCRCRWAVQPSSAGTLEPPEGCSAVYTVLEPGPAVLSMAETCGDAAPILRTQSANALLAPAGLSNFAPTADAGPDHAVTEGDTVVLDGRNSLDPDGDALIYQWAQVGGLGVTLDQPTSALTSFDAPPVQTTVVLRFRLTVSDQDAAADVDIVEIAVAHDAGAAGPITADAGPDQQVTAGQPVTLDGQGSTGTGLAPLTYTWTQSVGTPVDLSAAGQTVSFNAPDVPPPGDLLLFRLTVSEGGVSDSDDVLVHVFAGAPPEDGNDNGNAGDDPPPADGEGGLFPPGPPPDPGDLYASDAVAATAVNAPVVLSLVGGDADGDDLTFAIRKQPCDGTLGPVVQATPHTATVVYTPDAEFRGTDRLTFTASDGSATSAPAVYTVTVGAPKPFRAVFGSSNLDLFDSGAIGNWIADGMQNFGIKLNILRAPVGESDRVRLQQFAQAVAPVDGTVWVLFNWYGVGETAWLPITEPYVSDQGVVYPNAPCPQSDEIWLGSVTPRFVALANLTNPADPTYMPDVAPYLDGIVLDPELYASSLSNYPSPCHCDHCFQQFFQQQGITDPVPPPSARAAWLQANGLTTTYEGFERAAVRTRAAACRQAVHAVNPCMKIGGTSIVRFDRSPFYPGISEGFGVREAPVYEFSQKTFLSGFNDSVTHLQQQIAAAGLHVQLNMGLWMVPVPPDALTDHYYTLATRTDGVFLNGTGYYDNLAGQLCAPLAEVRQAVAAGNAELDRYEADPGYVSPYTGAPFVPACVSTFFYNFPTNLVPLEPGPAPSVGVTIRDESAYYFHADQGDAISLDVFLREFGNNDPGAGWWILLAPDGTTLDSAAFTQATSPSRVQTTAAATGVHTLIVHPSFIHGYHIDNASHPGAYRDVVEDQLLGTFRAHLLQPEPQLYGYVPPGVTVVGIKLAATFGETTEVLIHDERDHVNPLFHDIIGDTPDDTVETNLTLPLGNDPAGNGVVLEITFRNPGGADDLKFGFTAGALPYLSQTRSGLFHAP